MAEASNFRYRAVTAADQQFLRSLYASVREAELAMVPWSDAKKEAFVTVQFNAQTSHYTTKFPSARFDIIEINGCPIGRVSVDRTPETIHLIDIIIAPDYRCQGFGTEIMRSLLLEAAETDKKILLYVEQFNRARTLYDRLGFSVVSGDQIYCQMEWRKVRFGDVQKQV
jgi:ribosomal protein S18 acetylase RimI-like enzyme